MSYSRWIQSRWYTYWAAATKKKDLDRDNSIFVICNVANFRAKELREDIDRCAREAVTKDGGCATEIESDELKLYMREFLDDVDKEYPLEPAE